MEFEWDDDKRLANLAKHDVDLVLAAAIFDGRVFTQEDGRDDYGETRYQSVGYIGDDCFVVVWTQRDDVIRLISARRGGRRDRRRFAQGIA
ncbi:MAG: BrnT family toxin [Gemmobacter sp.]